ncbi:MAG: ChbG/HpnK family deacetylase [Chloroflexi bacterium]|nr:ChbG/HpnK family deacetylase [Chloroflexota bacterium]
MQRSLIVNADELGLTEGINEGIIEVHAHGIVTSTTMVANFWAFDHAVSLSRKYPGLAVGVHLNLTHGMPILPQDRVHTLVDENGYFFRRRPFLQRLIMGQISMIQVYEEFRAQVDKVIAAGIEPSHLDSHESVYMYPDLFFKVVGPVARHYRLPIRLQQERMDREMFSDGSAYTKYIRSEAFWKNHVMSALAHRYRAFLKRHQVMTTDHFLSTFSCLRRYPNDLTGGLARDLRELQPGTTELMVHPGFSDSRLEEMLDGGQVAARWREEEVRVLADDDLRALLNELKVELISYRELASRQLADGSLVMAHA